MVRCVISRFFALAAITIFSYYISAQISDGYRNQLYSVSLPDGEKTRKAVVFGRMIYAISEKGRLYSSDLPPSTLINSQQQTILEYYSKFDRVPIDEHEFIVDICCGLFHVVTISSNGNLHVWGGNIYGALGTGDYTDRIKPTMVAIKETKIIRIACGDYHTVVIGLDGLIRITGSNNEGQLGANASHQDSSSTFIAMNFTQKVTFIASRGNHSVAVFEDITRDIIAWGDDMFVKKFLTMKGDKTQVPLQKVFQDDPLMFLEVSYDGMLGITASGKAIGWGPIDIKQLAGDIKLSSVWYGYSTAYAITTEGILLKANGTVWTNDGVLSKLNVTCISENERIGAATTSTGSIVIWRNMKSSNVGRTKIRAIKGISSACPSGYEGPSCLPMCNGYVQSDVRACGPNGNCTSPNTCSCFTHGIVSTPTTNCGPVIYSISPVNVWSNPGATITITGANLAWNSSDPTSSTPTCLFTVMAVRMIEDPSWQQIMPCSYVPNGFYNACQCVVPMFTGNSDGRMVFVDLANDPTITSDLTQMHWSPGFFDLNNANQNGDIWDPRRYYILYHNSTMWYKNMWCSEFYDVSTSTGSKILSQTATIPFTDQIAGQIQPFFSNSKPQFTTQSYGPSNQTTLTKIFSQFDNTGGRKAFSVTEFNSTQLVGRTVFVEFALSNDTSSLQPKMGNVLELGLYSSAGHMIMVSLQQIAPEAGIPSPIGYTTSDYPSDWSVPVYNTYQLTLMIYSSSIQETVNSNLPTIKNIISNGCSSSNSGSTLQTLNPTYSQVTDGLFQLQISAQTQSDGTNTWYVLSAQLVDGTGTLQNCSASIALTIGLLDYILFQQFDYMWIGQSLAAGAGTGPFTLSVLLNRIGLSTSSCTVLAGTYMNAILLWLENINHLIIMVPSISGGLFVIFLILIIVLFIILLKCNNIRKRKRKAAEDLIRQRESQEAAARKKNQISPEVIAAAIMELNKSKYDGVVENVKKKDRHDKHKEGRKEKRKRRRKERRKEDRKAMKNLGDASDSEGYETESTISSHSSDYWTDSSSDGDHLKSNTNNNPEKRKSDDKYNDTESIDDISTISSSNRV